MTPILRLKQQIEELRGRRSINVDVRVLYDLVDDYEKMDSELRIRHNERISRPMARLLWDAIVAAYHNNNKSSEKVLKDVMECLTMLNKENQKLEAIRSMILPLEEEVINENDSVPFPYQPKKNGFKWLKL